MAERPQRLVTFLLTDIEGSTRRWRDDPDAMSSALTDHDTVLRTAVAAHGGDLFKHTGDGICAAFDSARAAIDAAIEAQHALSLPVRMGIATGDAEQRDRDYFGLSLSRAARVMDAAHGGQILVHNSTASVIENLKNIQLVDCGEHRLRDLGDATRLFEIHADGLRSGFKPPRTLSATLGNLPIQTTSFIGREDQIDEVGALVHQHRLVTLTGTGGVGKTRLALQAAAELAHEFTDGVWVVALAPIGASESLPDAVAAVLGVTPMAGHTVTECIARAVTGRRLLIVLDNCEHVHAAAADLVDALLRTTQVVQVLATSRESLRLGAEHVWPVPTLDVTAGSTSAAVELFRQRARSVNPAFSDDDPTDAAAVLEICRSLDGLALAIELAAARMISMSPADVRDRLSDRFRLLSGSRHDLEHHQTLRKAVSWSYDLLTDDERLVLDRCSVFADGFDLEAATAIVASAGIDEYTVLDLLDSLVRKSLITTDQSAGRMRFALLETIRQFGDGQLEGTGTRNDVRRVHALHFAEQTMVRWSQWNSPDQRDALDWVEREFANLRIAFRWAASHDELDTAVTIAAHTTMLTMALQRFESFGWVEDILHAATAANVVQLPRLYTAACVCALTGRPEVAVEYAEQALALEADPQYDTFEIGWSNAWLAFACRYAGRLDKMFEICDEAARRPGLTRVIGLVLSLAVLPGIGRSDEAQALAGAAISAARELGNPYWIAFAEVGHGRAYADSDPVRAMVIMRDALEYARRQRLAFFEVNFIREIAGLEGVLGHPEQALELLDTALTRYHRAGNHGSVATTLALGTVLFDGLDQPEVAVQIYGMSTRQGISMTVRLPKVLDDLRAKLGDAEFDANVDAGRAMEFDEAMEYVRSEIARVRRDLMSAESDHQ